MTLFLILAFYFTISSAQFVPRTFTIKNYCNEDIYVASNIPSHTGFQLKSHKSTSFVIASSWSGRLWGQSGCNFSSNGTLIGECSTCPDGAQCTLTEFTLGSMDFYDVSLVDGFTVPTSVWTDAPVPRPRLYDCGNITCDFDLKKCPPELVILNSDKSFKTCGNICGMVTNSTQVAAFPILGQVHDQVLICCGTRNTSICGPDTWPMSSLGINYYQAFKQQCNTSYVYPDDDSTSTFTCTLNANYSIVFCPSNTWNYGYSNKQLSWWILGLIIWRILDCCSLI